MRKEEIKRYIDRLNNKEHKETIFLREINDLVEVAKVWEKEPESMTDIHSYKFFFIKNDDNKYVGAVLDMYRDLHWYILEEERKKGHLTKSLQEVIIPYLFYDDYDERKMQRITIDPEIGELNYNNSKKVAKSLGFKPTNQEQTEFELIKDDFDWKFERLEERNGTISKERFKELRNRLALSYAQLLKISDELLMAYNDDKELRELAQKVKYSDANIQEIEWEYEEKNKS